MLVCLTRGLAGIQLGERSTELSMKPIKRMVRLHQSSRTVQLPNALPGPFVRIAPNHISISHSSALQLIYGHSVGILKSEFYDIFTSFNGTKSVFTTRSREEHARKRKILSHTFSQNSTLEFEPMMGQHIGDLIRQWDHMCAMAAEGKGGVIGETEWTSYEGCAVVDTLDCEFS